jgi:hypothetical protein
VDRSGGDVDRRACGDSIAGVGFFGPVHDREPENRAADAGESWVGLNNARRKKREAWNRNLAARIQSPVSGGDPSEISGHTQHRHSNSNSEEIAMAENVTTSWKELYERALGETDKQKLGELVLSAEAAIYRRYQDLQSSSNHHEERRTLKEAADRLLKVKVDELGWPPVN